MVDLLFLICEKDIFYQIYNAFDFLAFSNKRKNIKLKELRI
jgi:hypothetical protein